MKISIKIKIILSIFLKFIGLKALSKSIDPNLDILREVESSIFTHHPKKESTQNENKHDKHAS